ncbi:MAG TPA: hypothetical protein VGF99_20505 [Myxococcota bacterium]
MPIIVPGPGELLVPPRSSVMARDEFETPTQNRITVEGLKFKYAPPSGLVP